MLLGQQCSGCPGLGVLVKAQIPGPTHLESLRQWGLGTCILVLCLYFLHPGSSNISGPLTWQTCLLGPEATHAGHPLKSPTLLLLWEPWRLMSQLPLLSRSCRDAPQGTHAGTPHWGSDFPPWSGDKPTAHGSFPLMYFVARLPVEETTSGGRSGCTTYDRSVDLKWEKERE